MMNIRIGFDLPTGLHDELRSLAKRDGRSVTRQVRTVIENYLYSQRLQREMTPGSALGFLQPPVADVEPMLVVDETPPAVDETVRRWLELCPVDMSLRTPRSKLHLSYRILTWHPRMKLMSANEFYRQVRALGVQETKINGERFFLGIGMPDLPSDSPYPFVQQLRAVVSRG